MRGNNTFMLNGATMIEAVQEYLDKRMTPAPKVNSVAWGNGDGVFVVKVQEAPTAGEKTGTTVG